MPKVTVKGNLKLAGLVQFRKHSELSQPIWTSIDLIADNFNESNSFKLKE